MAAYANQFFPGDLLRRKGSSETLILPCVLGSCVFFLLLLSSDLDLITDIEMGRDSEEAPEKWELVLLVAFEGRWGGNHKPVQILSPQEGAGKQQQNSCQPRTPPSVFTPHTHVW